MNDGALPCMHVFVTYYLSDLDNTPNSIPGRSESFWKEVDCVKQLWKNRRELKVEDAGIAALFGLECFAW